MSQTIDNRSDYTKITKYFVQGYLTSNEAIAMITPDDTSPIIMYLKLMQVDYGSKLTTISKATNTNSLLIKSEFSKFMCLLALSKQKLAPCKTVDLLYHEVLKDRSLNDQICSQLSVGELHHDSSVKGSTLQNMYKNTLVQYNKIFGKMNKTVGQLWI